MATLINVSKAGIMPVFKGLDGILGKKRTWEKSSQADVRSARLDFWNEKTGTLTHFRP